MSTLREAAQAALEALELGTHITSGGMKAMAILRAALAEQQQDQVQSSVHQPVPESDDATRPPCRCGVKAASECDEEWGPQCDLGNNPKFVRVYEPQAEPVAVQQIMEQAQVFASAWSLVGSRFDTGDLIDLAKEAKDELREMVESALTAPPARVPLTDARVADVGFRFDGEKQVHVPTVLLEFEPVPVNSSMGNTSKGWIDRDAFARFVEAAHKIGGAA